MEKRLIDADAFAERMLKAWDTADEQKRADIVAILADIVTPILVGTPTVDAVEVVRCCDCKHCEVVNGSNIYAICKGKPKTLFFSFDIDTRTHFCSYGERKE